MWVKHVDNNSDQYQYCHLCAHHYLLLQLQYGVLQSKIFNGFVCYLLQSSPTISNSANSKSPLFGTKIEFPWIYPYVFNHLLSAISNPVIPNSPLFQTHHSFPTP